MRLGIMQPYLFPYIGYFQLMNAVDEFVVYDNIEYTKKGWINRNRILVNGTDAYITFPLKKDSDYLHIRDRYLADTWPAEQKKMLNRIAESYRKAPFFDRVFPLLEECISYTGNNLFNYTLHSLEQVRNYLDIKTPFVISSTLPIDHSLKSEQKVLAICKSRNAVEYINPIGGIDIYSRENFSANGIKLWFLRPGNITYTQLNNGFVPWLSIIDVMMFNSKEQVKQHLENFILE